MKPFLSKHLNHQNMKAAFVNHYIGVSRQNYIYLSTAPTASILPACDDTVGDVCWVCIHKDASNAAREENGIVEFGNPK